MAAQIFRSAFFIFVIMAAIGTAVLFSQQTGAREKAEKAVTPVVQLQGIGALGRIEPRSRVISLSHDAGPEGARIDQLMVAESQNVKKGDVIAVFSDLPRKQAKLQAAQAKSGILEAKIKSEIANKKFHDRDFARAQKLIRSQAIAGVALDDAERNQAQSTSALESLQAELVSTQAEILLATREIDQSRLLSPIDGTILKVMVRSGERVGDRGVVQIADLSQLDVVAEVYERDMPRIKKGQKAQITVPGIDQVFHGEVNELGYLVEKNDLNNTDPLADRDNRVVEVRIALDPSASEQLSHLIYMQVDVRLP